MPVPRYAWLIATLLFLFQIINFFDKIVLGLAAVPMMRDLGLTPSQYGLVAGSFFFLYWLSGVLVGLFVVHRMRSKWLLAVLVAVWSLAQVPVAMTSSLSVLLASRMVLGIGEGPGSPCAWHALFSWFPGERRNVPTAYVNFGPAIGSILGAPLLTWIILAYGWRTAFLVCGGIGLCWMLAWCVLGKEGPLAAPTQPVAGARPSFAGRVGGRRFWLDPTVLSSLVVGGSAYWAVAFGVAWLPAYLQQALHVAPRDTGLLVAAYAMGNGVMGFLVSFISNRMLKRGQGTNRARGVLNGVCLLISATLLVVAWAMQPSLAQYVFVAIGLGLPTVTFVLGPAIVGDVAPPALRGSALIVIYSLVSVIGFVVPVVVGRLVEGAGPERGFATAFLLSAAVLLFGGLVGAFGLRPERVSGVGEQASKVVLF